MATAAVAQPMAPNFTELQSKLNRKASFEEAIRECIQSITDHPEVISSEPFQKLLKRALTVMKTRFSASDVALWKSGLSLIRTALELCPQENAKLAVDLKSYEQQCLDVLGEDAEPSNRPTAPSRPAHTLFEGQLSSDHESRPHTNTAASSLQDLAAMLLGRQLAASQNDQTAPQSDQPSATSTSAEQMLSPEMAEALQRELDAIAVQIMEETAAEAPQAPPPASKSVLKSLPRIKVTAEKLAELGGEDARCPVCMQVEEGDEIMMLPCKHWAHPDCLDPWLSGTNTCPTCRHELPTDDSKYEEKKEREKIEEEERRGRENATNDIFLYI